MFLYESHLGGIYAKDYEQDFEELYCEQCGDCDWEIGEFNSAIKVLEYMADDISVNGSGGYDLNHVLNVLKCFDDCPDYKTAEKIVLDNKKEDSSYEWEPI